MAGKAETGKYLPGAYAKRKRGVEELVGHYVRTWEIRQMAQKEAEKAATASSELPPCITFSRKMMGISVNMVGVYFNEKQLEENLEKRITHAKKEINNRLKQFIHPLLEA